MKLEARSSPESEGLNHPDGHRDRSRLSETALRTKRQAFDRADRLTETTSGAGMVTRLAYDAPGRRTTVTEGVGSAEQRSRVQVQDKMGNLVERQDPGSAAP